MDFLLIFYIALKMSGVRLILFFSSSFFHSSSSNLFSSLILFSWESCLLICLSKSNHFTMLKYIIKALISIYTLWTVSIQESILYFQKNFLDSLNMCSTSLVSLLYKLLIQYSFYFCLIYQSMMPFASYFISFSYSLNPCISFSLS